MAGDIGVHLIVAPPRAVALAVGEVFEKGGNRAVVGRRGQPHARGEARAVGQGHEDVLDDFHLVRKITAECHPDPPTC